MSENEIEKIVKQAIVLKYDGVDLSECTNDAHLQNDLGGDSLDRLEVFLELEKEIDGFQFLDSDLEQIETVGQIIDYVKKGGAEGKVIKISTE